MSDGSWKNVKARLAGSLNKKSYENWIEPLRLVREEGNVVILGSPSEMARYIVSTNYLKLIQDCYGELGGPDWSVRFEVVPPGR